MKVLLYSEGKKLLAKSGIGKALEHQQEALSLNNVDYTLNPKDNYDVVHINTAGPASYFFAKNAKKKGKKVIVHAHSTEEDFRNSFIFSNMLAPLFKKWLIKMYNTGDSIVTPTEYSKKLIKNYGIEKPIYVVSNGINLSFFEKDASLGDQFRKEYGFKRDRKVVMSVGLYIERKGILDFVELARTMPEYDFIWFGYLDLKLVPSNIRKAVTTKLPNLYFPGYVKSEKLREAYFGADLFFFPTHEETEGIVVLEALATRQRVLLRDIPIYKDWILEDVHAYKGKNINEFKERISGILENKLPDLTDNGYKLAAEKDIKNVGSILKDIYQSQ